ncbi:MAG TPA: transporter [Thermodesulfovibrionales bacterium]|jgi:hypothetical protein|nr:transporter [Thermodesulfovibrionales bacterium]
MKRIQKPEIKNKILWVVLFFMINSGEAFAAIPLITDDTGTQGKGNVQIELFGEYGHDREGRVTTKNSDISATLTYGLIDTLDLAFISIPYQAWSSDGAGSLIKGDGLGDMAIEAKWRFYDEDGLSLALKPGLTIPTGNEDKGLGAGKMTYYLNLIASKELNPWAFHINLSYVRNDNKVDERKDLWHASFAATVDVIKNLKLVGDIGLATNPDSASTNPLAYILGGLIYSLRENLDIGLGLKGGLTKPEMDISIRGGITWRF